MKRGLLFIAALAFAASSFAWPRGTTTAALTAENSGDSRKGISVNVGTTTPVAIYAPTASARQPSFTVDRLVEIQNVQAFNLFLGTYPAVSATTGPRWRVAAATGTFKSTNTGPIYGIYESAAGSGTKEVIGYIEYDSKD